MLWYEKNANVATVLGLITASSDTVESEGTADEAMLNKIIKISAKTSI
jgi:hypothetical protein